MYTLLSLRFVLLSLNSLTEKRIGMRCNQTYVELHLHVPLIYMPFLWIMMWAQCVKQFPKQFDDSMHWILGANMKILFPATVSL